MDRGLSYRVHSSRYCNKIRSVAVPFRVSSLQLADPAQIVSPFDRGDNVDEVFLHKSNASYYASYFKILFLLRTFIKNDEIDERDDLSDDDELPLTSENVELVLDEMRPYLQADG